MPSAKSSAKTTTKTTSKTTAPVAETAPVTTKTTTTKTTKAKKEVAPAPTPAPVVEEVANVVVATDSEEASLAAGFTDFIARFQGIMTQFSSLKSELKVLERRTIKQVKVVQKLNKKKGKQGPRAPCGFVQPAPISDELASVLGKEKGSEMARTDVTREINKYIRANNLQDKDNGRKINPDKQLQTLLKIDKEVNLTYFNSALYGTPLPKIYQI